MKTQSFALLFNFKIAYLRSSLTDCRFPYTAWKRLTCTLRKIISHTDVTNATHFSLLLSHFFHCLLFLFQYLRSLNMHLEWIATYELFGNIIAVQSVSLSNSQRDAILIGLKDVTLSVVQYDPDTFELKTLKAVGLKWNREDMWQNLNFLNFLWFYTCSRRNQFNFITIISTSQSSDFINVCQINRLIFCWREFGLLINFNDARNSKSLLELHFVWKFYSR